MASRMHTGGEGADRHRMPAGIRRASVATVAIILAGALYLVAVRGEALLADLSALSQRVFCF